MLCSEGDGDDDADVQMDLEKHFCIAYPNNNWPPAASQWLNSPPTHHISVDPAKERVPMTNSVSGGRVEALPGTDRSLPGIADNGKNANSSTVVPVPTHVQLYIPAQQLSCAMIRTAVRTYCCVLGERGAWRGVERQRSPYRPRSGTVWRTTVIFLFLSSGPLL